jgi:hypothetical protein
LAEDCGIFTCCLYAHKKDGKILGLFEFFANREMEEDNETLDLMAAIIQ